MKKIVLFLLFVSFYSSAQVDKLTDKIWKIDYYVIDGVKKNLNKDDSDNQIYFSKDGSYELIENTETLKGLWIYDAKKNSIKIKIENFSIILILKIKILNDFNFVWEAIDMETGEKKISHMKYLKTTN